MPISIVKENEGRVVPLYTGQRPRSNSANISRINKRNSAMGKSSKSQHPPPRRRATFQNDSDGDSGQSVGGYSDSDDGEVDETIAALSNPNKTHNVNPETVRKAMKDSDDDDSDYDDNDQPSLRGGGGGDGGGEKSSRHNQEDDDDDAYDDDNDDDDDGGGGHHSKPSRHHSSGSSSSRHHRDDDEVSIDSNNSDNMSPKKKNEKKAELLAKFKRLEEKGVPVARKFTMKSKLSSMDAEMKRIQTGIEMDAGVKFQRRALIGLTSTLEFLNTKFDPFALKMQGWSESINDSITDYDDVFEQLFHKYRGQGEVAPELNLLLMLASSAFMFHLSKSFFGSGLDIGKLAKSNPDLVRNIAEQMRTASSNQASEEEAKQKAEQDKKEKVNKIEELLEEDRVSEADSFSSGQTGVRSITVSQDKDGKKKKTLNINV